MDENKFNFEQYLDAPLGDGHEEEPVIEPIKDDLIEDEPEEIEETPVEPKSKEPAETDELKFYYNFLVEQGLLDPDTDDEFDGTEEKLMEIKDKTLSKLRQTAIINFLEELPDNAKSVIQKTLMGLPLEDIDYTDVDITKPQNQKAILVQMYKKTTNFSDDKINRLISKLEEEELETEAIEAIDTLKSLREKELAQIELQKEKEQKELKQKQEEHRRILSSAIEENIKDTTRSKKVKALLFNPIKREKGVSTEFVHRFQEIEKNPKHFIQLADMLLDYDKDKGFNFDRFVKMGSKETVKNLKDRLSEAPRQSTKKSNQFDWAGFLNA